MKSEELQLEDWVAFKTFTSKVKRISKSLIDTYDMYEVLPSKLDGVPINKEMLVKNNFIKSNGEDSYTIELNESEYIEIRPNNSNPDYKWTVSFMTKNLTCRAFINSVHELQHLSKDAKIDLKIEL